MPIVYSATRQLYRKSGGIKEALKDFDSVRPTNVKVLQTGNGVRTFTCTLTKIKK